MNNPAAQSSQGSNYHNVQNIGQDADRWHRPPNIASTSGGGSGGGGETDKRVTVLETQVQSINTNITKIEDDVRDQRNWGIGLFLVLFGAIGGLYLYTDAKTESITNELSKIRIGIVKDIGQVKNDMNLMRSQNNTIINDLNGLALSVDKLVGLQNSVIKDRE